MDLFKPYSGSAGVGDSSADWQRAGQSSRLRRLGIAAWLLLLPGLASATPPIANPDAFGVAEGQSFSDNVLKNDSNPPPDTTLEARLNTGPTQHNGVFSLNPDGSFDYQHDGSENAQDSFTYTAVDPVTAESSGPVQVTISISPVNDTPVITGQDSLSTPEDTGLTISTADLDITDGDSSSFTLGIQPGPNYSISGNTINPSLNYAGPLTVPVTVSDGNSVSDPFALSVTVSPVNDQPVIQGQDTLSTLENSQLSISADDLDIVDPDSSSFTVILQGGANYSISGTTITPDTDFNGTLIVPTAVNDGSSAGNAVSEPFNLVVTVTSVNERPVITGQNPLSTPEEAELTLSVGDLTIVDGDSNSFTLDVGNGNNYSVSGNRITPDEDFNGILTVPVTVDDGSGESNSESLPFDLRVTVTAVNDRPVITGQKALSTPEETELTIAVSDLTIDDPDSNSFILDVRNGANYSVSGTTITPDDNFDGTLTVPVTVDDRSGQSNAESAQFNLSVSVTGVNDRPVITGQDPLSTQEEAELTLSVGDLTIVDGDSNSFTLDVGNGNNYSVSGNRITPDEDFNGILTVPVTVDDGSGESNSESLPFNLRVTVTAVNDQPVITGQKALSTPEETALTIAVSDLTIDDPDSNSFILDVRSGTNYSVSGTTITPDDNFDGTLTVPVTVDDRSGQSNAESAQFNLSVSVGAANDRPVITGQDPLTTPEDESLKITVGDLTIDDPDSNSFTLDVRNGANYSVAGDTITPDEDFNGTLTVPVTVDDGSGESNSESAPFNLSVSVSAVNDRPVITGQAPLSTSEETAITVSVGDLTIDDPDSNNFTLAVRNGDNYTVSGNNRITPADNFNGTLIVPVSVDDRSGESNSESALFDLNISVGSANDRPVITGQNPVTTPEETARQITVNDLIIDDPDSNSFTVDVGNGQNYSVAGNTITPDEDFDGTLVVPVTVDDGSGESNSESATFNLSVSVTAVNDRPVITDQKSLSTPEETALTITASDLTIVDPDSNSFTVDVRNGPNYSVSGSTITPSDQFNGTLSVPVTVNDGSGAGNAESAVFALSVSVSAENDPPEVDSAIGDRSTSENDNFSLDVSGNFSDPDGDPLTFSASGLPPTGNFTMTPAGLLRGTADDDDVGSWQVTVSAQDPDDARVNERFTLTVLNVNDRPRITGQSSLSMAEETSLTVQVSDLTIEDPDNDSFSLALQNGANYSVNGTTITPDENFSGRLSVSATVDDGSGASNSTSPAFDLVVDVDPVNDRPVIDGQQPIAFDEDTSRAISLGDLIVTDPDNAYPQDFSIIVGDGANYTRSGATITPTANFNGDLTVPVRVDDGSGAGNSLSQSVNLTVTVDPVNDKPQVVSPIGNRQTLEDEAFNLNVASNFRDIENDTLTFTATGQPGSISISSDGRFSGTPTNDDVGQYTVVVRAADPSQAFVTSSFRLTIVNVNDQPQIVGQSSLITPEETALEITLDALVVSDPDNTYPGDFTLSVSDGPDYRLRGNTITPADEFAGVLSVPVTVDDGSGASNAVSDSFILSVTVTSENDVPVITGQQPAPMIIDEDESLTIGLANLLVQDPDDVYPDDFTLNVLTGDSYTVTGPDSIAPDPDFNGLLVVNVTVTDPEATSPQFGLIVDVQPVNDAPEITGQLPLSTEEETAITVTVSDLIIDDPDIPAQTQILTLGSGENYSLENNTVTPVENFFGTLLVPAVVNDGLEDSATFDVLITVGAVNDAPVITGQQPLSTPEDVPLTVVLGDLTVDDPDNDYPTGFTLTVLPGDNYTASDGTVTPALDFSGDLSVPVVVNDGENDSQPFTLTISVLPVNDVPVITGQVDLSTEEDTPILVTLTDLRVQDPDNVYPADFNLSLAPGENYTVSGTTVSPLSNFNGRLDVPATVSDGQDSSAPFVLRIRVLSANDAPTLVTPIPDQQAVEDEFFRLNVSDNFDDSDGDALTFSIEGLPETENLSFNPNTGVLSGTPDFNDTRDFPYEITVTAADESGATGSGSFELTIAALDRANVALTIAATPSPAVLGDDVRWTFTINNAGPSGSTNLGLLGEFMGEGLTVSPGSGADCLIEPNGPDETRFDCQLPDIATGAQAVVVFMVSRDEPGDVVAAAEAVGRQELPIDPNTSDNSDQLSASIARNLSNGAVQTLGTSNVRSLASGDVDGDGDADLVLGTDVGQAAEIYAGTGFRTFEETPTFLPDNASNEDLLLIDLDDDDDLDLVFANGGGLPDTVYLNDGDGGFLPVAALGDMDSRGVTAADFNGDGQLDIAFAGIGSNPIYLNDGAGGYLAAYELGNAASLGIDSDDFNGDGWPDLVFANSGGPSRIYLNDGGTGFLPAIRLSVGTALDVTVVRADGNGSPDLAFARVPNEVGDLPANPVLLNDGSGNFTISERLGASPTLDIIVGDINGDNRDDLIFINSTGTHQVWRGGAAGFRLAGEQIVEADAIAGNVADLGNDGGDDLAMSAGSQGGADLFLNDSFGRLGLGDAIPPTLTLLGNPTVSIEAGTAYADEGAEAMDDIDGDISDEIEVNNPVNSTLVGSYTVTYRVKDFAGNPAEPVTRKVQVTPAAGTGGGGGGSMAWFELLLLFAGLIAGRRARRTGTLGPLAGFGLRPRANRRDV